MHTPQPTIYGYGRNVYLWHFPGLKSLWPKCPGQNVRGRNVLHSGILHTFHITSHYCLLLASSYERYFTSGYMERNYLITYTKFGLSLQKYNIKYVIIRDYHMEFWLSPEVSTRDPIISARALV